MGKGVTWYDGGGNLITYYFALSHITLLMRVRGHQCGEMMEYFSLQIIVVSLFEGLHPTGTEIGRLYLTFHR